MFYTHFTYLLDSIRPVPVNSINVLLTLYLKQNSSIFTVVSNKGGIPPAIIPLFGRLKKHTDSGKLYSERWNIRTHCNRP